MDSLFTTMWGNIPRVCILIVIVLLVRGLFILADAPRRMLPVLWIVVLIAMAVPFTIQTSLYPDLQERVVSVFGTSDEMAEVVHKREDISGREGSASVTGSDGSEDASDVGKAETDSSFVKDEEQLQDSGKLEILVYIWLTGCLLGIGYIVVSLIRLRLRLEESKTYFGSSPKESPKSDNNIQVYMVQGLETAFVIGVFNPSVYLPEGLSEEVADKINAHEMMHIKRRDPLLKLLCFVLCIVYWFVLPVWIVYFFLSRDIEAACDEAVIRDHDEAYRRSYATALLALATGTMRTYAPPAFSEGSPKRRIEDIMNFKKKNIIVTLICLVVLAGVVFVGVTSPKASGRTDNNEVALNAVRDIAFMGMDDLRETDADFLLAKLDARELKRVENEDEQYLLKFLETYFIGPAQKEADDAKAIENINMLIMTSSNSEDYLRFGYVADILVRDMPEYATYYFREKCKNGNLRGISYAGESEIVQKDLLELLKGSDFWPEFWYQMNSETGEYSVYHYSEPVSLEKSIDHSVFFAVNADGDILDFTDVVAQMIGAELEGSEDEGTPDEVHYYVDDTEVPVENDESVNMSSDSTEDYDADAVSGEDTEDESYYLVEDEESEDSFVNDASEETTDYLPTEIINRFVFYDRPSKAAELWLSGE